MGTVAWLTSPLTRWHCGLGGLLFMVAAMALQGRGHKLEPTPPIPFASPFDLVARIFVEQWVTFPRYVLTGGFRKAWKASGR